MQSSFFFNSTSVLSSYVIIDILMGSGVILFSIFSFLIRSGSSFCVYFFLYYYLTVHIFVV